MLSGNTNPDLPQNTLQIKEDDKFFSRLLSKESSMAQPSLRVYYGGISGSVPFMWESQPGTPKYTFRDNSLPPLTPPPSYYSKSNQKPIKEHSRSNLLKTLFLRMIFKKSNNNISTSSVPFSPSSSSSWSSLNSSIVFSINNSTRRSRFSTPCSSFDSRADDHDDEVIGWPNSTLCFDVGTTRGTSSGLIRGCYGR